MDELRRHQRLYNQKVLTTNHKIVYSPAHLLLSVRLLVCLIKINIALNFFFGTFILALLVHAWSPLCMRPPLSTCTTPLYMRPIHYLCATSLPTLLSQNEILQFYPMLFFLDVVLNSDLLNFQKTNLRILNNIFQYQMFVHIIYKLGLHSKHVAGRGSDAPRSHSLLFMWRGIYFVKVVVVESLQYLLFRN